MSRLDRYLGRTFLQTLILCEVLLLVALWFLPGLQGLSTPQRLGLHHLALPVLTLAAAHGLALQLRSRGEWLSLLSQGRSPLQLLRAIPAIVLLVWLAGSLLPGLDAGQRDWEARFLHLEAAHAFSGSEGLVSYERREGPRLHGVLWCVHGQRPRRYASVYMQTVAGGLRFVHGGELLPDLRIRYSRPDREVRSRILARPALVSWFSSAGLLYHGLHLLLSLALPMLAFVLAMRYGLPRGEPAGYVMPLLVPAALLLVTFLLLALQASGQLI